MNDVLLKGKKDKLVIQLNENIEMNQLKDSLKKKLEESKAFFQGAKLAIEFSGRELSDQEEDELLRIVVENGVEVTFFISDGEMPVRPAFLRSNIIEEGNTRFHKGSLRSGKELNVDGSVVILGDVNPGATIKATGNIIVLGYLNGIAYAGGIENDGAFIVAFKMNPIQLKIANFIARNPNKDILNNNRINKEGNLEIAFVKDEQIMIEELNRKTLDKMIKL